MYFRTPRNIHLELTDKCNARCPMCRRTNPDGLGDADVVQNKELSFDLISRRLGKYTFNRINYCGNLGDPIVARDMLPIVEFMSHRSRQQVVHTNGSLRNRDWWRSLAKVPNMRVVYGIDGVDQPTHEFYRRGTTLDTVLANAAAFIEAGGDAVWQFIVFEHNRSQLEQARAISAEMGFSVFEVVQTRRFALSTNFPYKYNNEYFVLEKPSNSPIEFSTSTAAAIQCTAKHNEEIFVAADGQVWPCCYVAGHNNKIDRNPHDYDLWSHDLSCIAEGIYFDDVESSFTTAPMLACSVTCGMQYKNQRQRVINIKPVV